MGSFSEDDEEYRFFDAQENIASVSDFDSDYLECTDSFSGSDYCVSSSCQYDVWLRSPRSVQERRNKFLRWMGLSLDRTRIDDSVDAFCDVSSENVDRIMESCGTISRTPIFEEEFSSSRSSMSNLSNDALDSSRGQDSEWKYMYRVGNYDGGMECNGNVDGLGLGGNLHNVQLVGADQSVAAEKFENTSSSSTSVQQIVHREIEVASNLTKTINRLKNRWFSRLKTMTCTTDRRAKAENLTTNGSDTFQGNRVRRVKVRHCRKRLKELSALFAGQDIQAHEGSILSMKFSLDGQYLASAGEDMIVRVWQVVEDKRSNDIDIPDVDPSCVYFTVNQLSELAPLVSEKEKMSKSKSLRKTTDSACVIFPPKVFRISQKPLHEFRGHNGEILDLSWSQNNCLLSSSADKTVRLWRVGSDQCLKIFPHNNYVTCVQFNPMDDNYFVSGSIDGKIRIWEINSGQVVDWTGLRDIVTAVSYRPDGKGGIIGSMTGTCRFFNLSDNYFQLEAQICLNGKKKSPCRRIIGFQFLPQDPSKILVTCSDSQIRILQGINVIAKYKGLRNAGNQILASFTSDGKHIVSASEDNVYLWSWIRREECSLSQSKTIRSFECFSTHASVVIPWSGLKSGNSEIGWPLGLLDENSPKILSFSSSACFSLGQEFILESIPKGSATWPEEKLPASSPRAMLSTIRKSQYKFLKSSCQSSVNSHAWGMVIVTAGWDGRIRSFLNYGLPVAL